MKIESRDKVKDVIIDVKGTYVGISKEELETRNDFAVIKMPDDVIKGIYNVYKDSLPPEIEEVISDSNITLSLDVTRSGTSYQKIIQLSQKIITYEDIESARACFNKMIKETI